MIRALLGVGAVTLLALWAVLDYYRLTASYNRDYQDVYRIGAHLERWEDVRSLAPGDAVVGYVSDMKHEDPAGAAAFLATQYALAPRLLVYVKPGRKVRWVVGAFSRPPDLEKIQAEHGLRLVRDFGDGRALFETRAR
ncbi:MAG: hypothetical protein FJW34_18125 [Acidobacteria bacterium]|nr:hypothetical protein [Acidobacteriota bacterium]